MQWPLRLFPAKSQEVIMKFARKMKHISSCLLPAKLLALITSWLGRRPWGCSMIVISATRWWCCSSSWYPRVEAERNDHQVHYINQSIIPLEGIKHIIGIYGEVLQIDYLRIKLSITTCEELRLAAKVSQETTSDDNEPSNWKLQSAMMKIDKTHWQHNPPHTRNILQDISMTW